MEVELTVLEILGLIIFIILSLIAWVWSLRSIHKMANNWYITIALAVLSSIFAGGLAPFNTIAAAVVFFGGIITSFMLGFNNGMGLVLIHLSKAAILLALFGSLSNRLQLEQFFRII